MIGYVKIGNFMMEIQSVQFDDGVMYLKCEAGPEDSGLMAGYITITDPHGIPVLKGTKIHDFGMKAPVPATWKVCVSFNIKHMAADIAASPGE